MDTRVRDYLIGAHNKVIGHYRQLLEAGSLAPPERDRIQRGLARIEARRYRDRPIRLQAARSSRRTTASDGFRLLKLFARLRGCYEKQ